MLHSYCKLVTVSCSVNVSYNLYDTLSKLYRDLCLLKRLQEQGTDQSRVCPDCRSLKPPAPASSKVLLLSVGLFLARVLFQFYKLIMDIIEIWDGSHRYVLETSEISNFSIQRNLEVRLRLRQFNSNTLPLQDLGLQACYDCLNKICYSQCGQFWYSSSVNWPKVRLCLTE